MLFSHCYQLNTKLKNSYIKTLTSMSQVMCQQLKTWQLHLYICVCNSTQFISLNMKVAFYSFLLLKRVIKQIKNKKKPLQCYQNRARVQWLPNITKHTDATSH